MMLGMGKWKISKILIIETLFVGAISLIAGLCGNIPFTRFISINCKMFLVELSQYKFVISWKAIGKIYFIFWVDISCSYNLNTLVISKYKLIDLINSSRKVKNHCKKCRIILYNSYSINVILVVALFASVTNLDFNDYRF